MTGLLAGKYVVVTGALTRASIGYAVARHAQEQGAQVVLTGYGRMRLIEQLARSLPHAAPVVELDVTRDDHLASLAQRLGAHVPRVDGMVHAIAFAPPGALNGQFLQTPWPEVATTLHVSAYSLQALTRAVLPLMPPGGAVVGLDFDATVTWPSYDWMGVAKSALEACARYLARDLGRHGIRINLVAAGPVRTVAAHGEHSFDDIAAAWRSRAPLGWDTANADGIARSCVALLSDWFPVTTGEIVHADGGFHSMGV